MIKGKKILLGVTGGIAAYKACDLAHKLVYAGAEVTAVMTKNACEFVTPLTFQTLTGKPVYTEMFRLTSKDDWQVDHVELGKACELMVIAPATANIIGKIANGIADDILTTTVLSLRQSTPVYICPAMNTRMWKNKIVAENVAKLKKHGFRFIGPAAGKLACGDTGEGRLESVTNIFEELTKALR